MNVMSPHRDDTGFIPVDLRRAEFIYFPLTFYLHSWIKRVAGRVKKQSNAFKIVFRRLRKENESLKIKLSVISQSQMTA